MKTFRRPATAVAVALGLTASLLVAAPATSADFYVVDSDLGAEDPDSNRGYPDNIWFTGASTTGTQTTTDDGLVVTGRTMLLHGAAEIPLTGDSFIALVQSAAVDADGPWSFQLPVYFDNDAPGWFTTFRPAANNTVPTALDGEWITSRDTGGFYNAGDTLTLQEIADEIDDAIDFDLNPALLAFGVLVDSGETTVASVTFNGDTHFFTAAPEDVEDDEEVDEDEDDEVEDAAPAAPVEDEATFTG